MKPDHFPILLALFAASGLAASIYEIVWFQLLQLVIGSTAISLAILLGTFMGGMCIGSLALPKLAGYQHHPLRIYAAIEAGIGIIAVLILFLIPHAGGLYMVALSAVCLLPPTLLMGATLPVIARSAESTPRGISSVGFLYAANIAGAVVGSLLAGFYLLRVYDISTATYAAVGINLLIAISAFSLSSTTSYRPSGPEGKDRLPSGRFVYDAACIVIFMSGVSAMGAEVVWTRLLSLLFGASVYAFSIILAVFLLGLGIGSSAGALLCRYSKTPRRDLGICQMLAAFAVAWAAFMLAKVLPFWPLDPTLVENPWLNFQVDVVRAVLALLPATCLWGASFPLALAAIAHREEDTGKLAGTIYAANTLGAIIGAVLFSVLFIQWFGSRVSQQTLVGISVVGGFFALKKSIRIETAGTAAAIAALCLVAVPPIPDSLMAYGRSLPRVLGQRDAVTQEHVTHNILYAAEGMNAAVAVSETPPDTRSFHVSGKIEASTLPWDMRLQRMLGHLPGLLHKRPRSVLIVGFGAGVTAGTFVDQPTVERIVICEIEPLIPKVVAKYFATQNRHVAEDPRVQIISDDARHYLLTTTEHFDIISSDPIHPWVKGSAALYTQEYFDLVRRHLNPGGLVSQWVPLYSTTMDAVKSELATFFRIFPEGTVWSNDRSGRGYDIVLLGGNDTGSIDAGAAVARFNRLDHANVAKSLHEVGFGSAADLLATYVTGAADLSTWLQAAEINRDLNLRLQYLAGMGLDFTQENLIYDSIAKYRGAPDRVFTGSPELVARLLDRRPPRALTLKQATAISNTLAAGPSRRIGISAAQGNEEGLHYATQLSQALAAGGWHAQVRESVFSAPVDGLHILVGTNPPRPEANELFRALRAAGLEATGSFDRTISDSVVLVVGTQN